MELRLARLIALICLCAITTDAGPILGNSNKCAKICKTPSDTVRYEIGKTYAYNYETSTKLHLKCENDDGPQVTISGQALIHVHDSCEFTLQLRETYVRGPVNRESYKRTLEAHDLPFGYSDGKIESVCPATQEDEWALNVKKAIISSLQVSVDRLIDGPSKRTVHEDDLLGAECQTSYDIVSSGRKISVTRSKDLKTCANGQQAVTALFPRSYASSLGAIRSLPLATAAHECETDLDPTDGIIKLAKCTQTTSFVPLTYSIHGGRIESSLKMSLSKVSLVSAPKSTGHLAARRQSITMTLTADKPTVKSIDYLSLQDIVKSLCASIDGAVDSRATGAFGRLVEGLRAAGAVDVNRLHGAILLKELCESDKMMDLFLDAAQTSGSEAALRLLTELTISDRISKTRATYFMIGLPFISRPTRGTIEAILPLLEQDQVPRAALLGVSGHIRNYCTLDSECGRQAAVQTAIELITRDLDEDRQDEVVAALKALENIAFFDSVPPTVSKLVDDLATDKSKPDTVRVGAIQALGQVATRGDAVRRKLLKVFRTESDSVEVRIAAYQAVARHATDKDIDEVLEQLRRETVKQVGSYVVSHLSNLKESSDPEKAAVTALLAEKTLPTDRFPSDIRRYSRNVELSLHQATMINVGGVLEADTVFDKSYVPKSLHAGVKMPAFGRMMDLVGVTLRQQGMEQPLERIFGPRGYLATNKGNFPEILRDLIELFTDEAAQEAARKTLSKRSSPNMSWLGRAQAVNDVSRSDVMDGQLFITVDGKTVMYLDLNDATRQPSVNWQELIEKLKDTIEYDHGFGMQFMDTSVQIPTVNGLPVKLDFTSTALVGLKATLTATLNNLNGLVDGSIIPSFAYEHVASVTFDAIEVAPGLKWTTKLTSAPMISAKGEVTEGRIGKLSIRVPQEQIELVKFSSDMNLVEANGNQRPTKSDKSRKVIACTSDRAAKLVGLALCAEGQLPTDWFRMREPFTMLNNHMFGQILIKKTDSSLSSYDLVIELPAADASESWIYKAAFATPGSSVDREIAGELELISQRLGQKGFKVALKSPIKTLSAGAYYRNDRNEVALKAEAAIDHDKYLFDIGLERAFKGRKWEYKPRLTLEASGHRPTALRGSLSMVKGRKNQLQFDLHSQQGGKSFVRGNVLQEQVKPGETKLSTDLSLSLGGFLDGRLWGSCDSDRKTTVANLNMDYTAGRVSGRKQSAKLIGKLNNLSTGSLIKYGAFVELVNSQWPQYNWNGQYVLVAKQHEHLENELKMRWGGNLRDQSRSVNLLQVTKVIKSRTDSSLTYDNKLVIQVPLLAVNWEGLLRTQVASKDQTPAFKVELRSNDKGRKRELLEADFEYRQESRKPLKLAIDAQVKYPGRHMVYKDRLEEQGNNEYVGHTEVQWQVNRRASADYTYKYRSDASKLHHELDLELATPWSREPVSHKSVLKWDSDAAVLRSLLKTNGELVYSVDSTVAPSATSKATIEIPTVHLQGDLALGHPTQKMANLQVTHRPSDMVHKTSLVKDGSSYKIVSTTGPKRSDDRVLDLEAELNLPPERDEGLFARSTSSPLTAALKLASTGYGSHASRVVYHPATGKTELASLTEDAARQKVAAVKGQLDTATRSYLEYDDGRREGKFAMDHRQSASHLIWKCPSIDHETKLALGKTPYTLDSKTRYQGARLLNVAASVAPDAESQVNIDSPRADLKAKWTGVRKASVSWKCPRYEHQTEWNVNKNDMKVTSKTAQTHRSVKRPVVELDASLSRNARSQIDLDIAPLTMTSKLTLEPVRQGKQIVFSGKYDKHNGEVMVNTAEKRATLKVDSPRYRHDTVIKCQLPTEFDMTSKSERTNGAKLADIRVLVSRVNPSTVKVYLPEYTGLVYADFVSSPTRTAKVDLKWPENVHESALTIDDSAVKYVGRHTRSGEQGSLDMTVTRDAGSLTAKTPDHQLILNGHMKPSKTGAKLEYVGKRSGYVHVSDMSLESSGFKVTSQSTAANRQIMNLDSHLSSIRPSHIDLTFRQVNGRLVVDIVSGSSRSGKLTVKSPSYEHVTELKADDDTVLLTSKSDSDRRKIMHLTGVASTKIPSLIHYDDGRRVGKLEVDTIGQLVTVSWSCPRCDINAQIEAASDYKFTMSSVDKRSGQKTVDVNALVTKPDAMRVGGFGLFAARQSTKPMMAKLDVNVASLGKHHTEVKYDDSWTLDMKTSTMDIDGVKVNGMTILLSNNRPSSVEYEDVKRRAKVDVDMDKTQATWSWRCPRLEHAGQVTATRVPYVFNTLTTSRPSGSKMLETKISLDFAGESSLLVETVRSSANLQVAYGLRKGSMSFKCPKYDHLSSWMVTDNDVTVKSRTTPADRPRQALVTFDLKGSRFGPSTLELEVAPTYKALLTVDPTGSRKEAKVSLKAEPMKHETTLTWGPQITVDSLTESARERIARIEAVLAAKEASRLAVATPWANGEGSYNPAVGSARVHLKSDSHEHLTEFRPEGANWVFESETKAHKRPLMTLKSKVAPADEMSTLNLITPALISSLEVRPAGHAPHYKVAANQPGDWEAEALYAAQRHAPKTARVKLASPSLGSHETKFMMHRNGKLELDTRTVDPQSQRLHEMKGQVDPQAESWVEYLDSSRQAKLSVDHKRSTGQWSFKNDRIDHVGEVKAAADSPYLLNTETKQDGAKLLSLAAALGSDMTLDMSTAKTSVKAKVAGWRQGAVLFKCPRIEHSSEWKVNRRDLTLISKTMDSSSRKPIVSVNGLLSLDSKTTLEIDVVPMMAQGKLVVDPLRQGRRVILTGKYDRHNGDVKVDTAERKAVLKFSSPTYRHESVLDCQWPTKFILNSKSDRRGKNLADISVLVSRVSPTTLKVTLPEYNGEFVIDMVSSGSKRAKVDLKWPENVHESALTIEPATLKFTGRHIRAGELRSIDLTANRQASSLTALSPDHQLTLTGSRNSRLSAAKMEYIGKRSGLSHLTDLSYDTNGLKLNTQTAENGKPFVVFDSAMSMNQPSHMELNTEPIKGRLDVDLVNDESRTAKLAFKTPSIGHKSELSYGDSSLIVKSEHDVNGRKYAHVTGILSATLPTLVRYDDGRRLGKFEFDRTTGLTQVSWSCPSMDAQGQLELSPEYKLSLSATDKRTRAKIIDLAASLSQPTRQEYGLFGRSGSKSVTGKLDLTMARYGKHHTEVKYEDAWTLLVNSKTLDTANRQIAVIKVLLSDQTPSIIEYEDSVRRGKVAVNVRGSHGSWTWKCPRYEHDGELSLANRPYKLTMVSRSLTTGVKHLELRATCDPSSNSLVTIELPHGSGKIDVSSGFRQGSVAFKCPRYDHVSEWNVNGRDVTVKSRTSPANNLRQTLVNLDARLSRNARSAVDFAMSNNVKLNAIYEPTRRVKSGKVTAQYDTLTHSTTVEYDQMRPSLSVNSLTESRGSQLAKVDAVMSAETQSRLDIETGSWSSEAFFNPQTKNGRFEIKSRPLNHLTEFRREGRSAWAIESQTNMGGRQVALIKSHIATDPTELSTGSLVMPSIVTNFEVRPASPRFAKLTLKSDRYDHETELNSLTDGSVKVKSSTLRNGDQLFKLDTLVSPDRRPSHLIASAGKSMSLNANLNPTEKTAKLAIDTPEYQHETSAALDSDDNSVLVKSKTRSEMITMLHDVIDNMEFEFDNPLYNRVGYLTRDAVKSYLARVPANTTGARRFVAIDPGRGELDLEIRASLENTGSRLNEIYREQVAKYAALRSQVTAAKSMLTGEWMPPFRSKAIVVGGQHFITFDKHFYDFAGTDCTYLLARDHIDGNFTVMAKYHPADRSGAIRKSIIVHVDNENVIELDNAAKQVKLNGQVVELPLYLGKASVIRKLDSIVIDDTHGVTVECQLSRDICSVSMSGFYFGKTNGLFGRYDYESENDMHRPGGASAARQAYELARAYEMDTGCRTQNVARDEEVKPGSEGYEICHGYFIDPMSPLGDGFGLVPPEDYFRMCLRHVAAARRNDLAQGETARQAACTVAAAYVHQLSTLTTDVQLPSDCLACSDHGLAYGAQSQQMPRGREADVIFVIEEQECAKPIVDQIDSLARLIEREMTTAGFKSTKFGVVAFGGPEVGDYVGEPHAHTARGELLFGAHDVVLATEKMTYKSTPRGGRRPSSLAFDALAFAAEFPLRAGANKQVILVTCSQCSSTGSILDYSDVQRLLLDEGITVHVLADRPISVRGGSDTKSRSIYGVDSETVFRGKDLSQKPLVGARDLRSQIAVPKDLCVALAQESHGSFFSTLPFVQSPKEAKQWKSLVARRLSTGGQEPATGNACVVCECMSTRDGLSSRAACRPCESRPAKLPPYLYTLESDDYEGTF